MRSLSILILLIASLISKAQPVAYFEYKVFRTEEQTYIETYLNFDYSSLNYITLPNGHFQAKVDATIIVSLNDSMVTFTKNQIYGPEIIDSAFVDFIDMQRLNLKPGKYQVEIDLTDANKPDSNKVSFKQELVVPVPPDQAYLSDVVFLGDIKPSTTPGPFTRGDKDLFPLITDYFPQEISTLMFYNEIYNSNKADSTGNFLFLYRIANPKTGKTVKTFQRVAKQRAAPIIPVIGSINIAELPSGDFDLVTEIRNTKNDVVFASKKPFKRSNVDIVVTDEQIDQILLDNSFVGQLNNMDTLSEYIFSLRPIANDREKQTIDMQKDILNSTELKKKFFYTFWANHAPIDPSLGWQDYYAQVLIANKYFSTRIRKGYETDRGRVYLQYGPPNVRTERPSEPAAYPYEIWQYYKIKQYSNRRFIFWNQDLVSNDYELLHSDMFGEPRNQMWERYLMKRSNPMDNSDKKKNEKQFGGNADDFFNNPR